MSVSSVGASSNAYSYLQSLLQQQSASGQAGASSDPVATLLDAFYPTANSQQNGAASPQGGSAVPASGPPAPALSPDTMANLIAIQEQQNAGVSSQTQSVFAEFDTNGDGQISKSEFESAFGSGADMSKVDGLFNALDSNQDGSISLDELTSAAKQSQAAHHHHHHAHGGGSGEGGLADLLMSSSQGATSQTTANSDGSSTTTITYADGSKVTMTTPPASSAIGSSSGGTGTQGAGSNFIEQLIQLQSQLPTPQSSGAAPV